MEDTILYSFLSFLFFLLALKLHQSRKSRRNFPPSPPALPIIGHLHLLKPPMHRTFTRIAQKYGPIISIRFGSQLVVVVSSLSAVEECFTKNDIVFANRPNLLLGKYLAYNNTSVVQAPYGDHWRNLRRICAIEIFSNHRLNLLLNVRKEEIKRLMIKFSQNALQDFAKVEFNSVLHELTFNIMMRMVAGKRYYGDDVTDEEEARQFRQIMAEVSSIGGASNPGDFMPILNWINGDFEKKAIRLSKRTDKFLQRLIDEHRNKEEGLESMNTMIDHLLSLQESQPEYYTDQIIKGLVLVMLLAGTGTSAVTMEWAMSNLLNHPNILSKVSDELNIQIGQDSLLDEPHLSKLPYLQNVILETFRLNPTTPLLVPHMSSDDCIIGGYDVSRGTMLLVNTWAIHRDPTLWEDSTTFKPERFEDREAEAHKLVPFGLGRRACPGAGLAQRVVGLTLGSLIQCFEWKRPSEEEIDMTEGRGITTPKVQPLEALCKARPIMHKILS